MSEEAASVSTETVTETTSDNPLVNKPHVSPKPYDDAIFESYDEPETEVADSKIIPPVEPAKVEEKKVEEESKDPDSQGTKDTIPVDKLEEFAVKRPINGKEVEFKIKDAITAYTKQEEFNRNMDRRLTHVSQREKAWQSDQDNFKDRITSVMKVAQTGNFVEGIKALAKLAAGDSGLDVATFEKQYFEQLEKVRDVYTKMTPEQQEAYWAKRALEDEREKTKRYVEKEDFEKSKTNLQQHVDSLMKQNSLTPDEFWSNYKFLVEEQVGEGKKYASDKDVTAEEVVGYTTEVRQWEKVYSAGEIAKIDDENILEELKKVVVINPDYSAADLAKILQDAGIGKIADKSTVENLNRKVGSSRFSQASSTKKQNGKIEGLDEEDLDFLYRNQPKTYTRPKR